jgi:hypothetical protein
MRRRSAGSSIARGGNVRAVRFGRPSLLGLIYLVVGIIVAANKDYLQNIETVERVVSALLAILLWPLLFLGVDLHVNF